MLTFLDEPQRLMLDWPPAGLDVEPRWLAWLEGPQGPRVGGAYSETARSVCGLRVWDDAREGVVDQIPWVLFEVEKLVRMLLHRSGLAFEILAAGRATHADFDGREVLRCGVTRGVLAHFRDVATPLLETNVDHAGWRWRNLLTGAALANEGIVSFDEAALRDATAKTHRLGEGEPPNGAAVRRLLDTLDQGDALPESPADYAWLDEFVAAQRMGDA